MALKQFTKTNGDKIRSMNDKKLAELCITTIRDDNVVRVIDDGEGVIYLSKLTNYYYTSELDAYKANLEYLKQEYKGE